MSYPFDNSGCFADNSFGLATILCDCSIIVGNNSSFYVTIVKIEPTNSMIRKVTPWNWFICILNYCIFDDFCNFGELLFPGASFV